MSFPCLFQLFNQTLDHSIKPLRFLSRSMWGRHLEFEIQLIWDKEQGLHNWPVQVYPIKQSNLLAQCTRHQLLPKIIVFFFFNSFVSYLLSVQGPSMGTTWDDETPKLGKQIFMPPRLWRGYYLSAMNIRGKAKPTLFWLLNFCPTMDCQNTQVKIEWHKYK